MQTSKITIARLFNLGNYEHVRYEITVDIAPGESAGTAIVCLENIMASLSPTPPPGVSSVKELNRESQQLKIIEEMDPERVQQNYGDPKEMVVNERRKQLLEADQKTKKWYEMRRKARVLLDNLGGAVTFTDHKELWDDDNYPDWTNA